MARPILELLRALMATFTRPAVRGAMKALNLCTSFKKASNEYNYNHNGLLLFST